MIHNILSRLLPQYPRKLLTRLRCVYSFSSILHSSRIWQYYLKNLQNALSFEISETVVPCCGSMKYEMCAENYCARDVPCVVNKLLHNNNKIKFYPIDNRHI